MTKMFFGGYISGLSTGMAVYEASKGEDLQAAISVALAIALAVLCQLRRGPAR